MSRIKRLLVLFLKAENKPNDCFELTWSKFEDKSAIFVSVWHQDSEFLSCSFPPLFLSLCWSFYFFFFSPQDSEFTFCLFPHCFSLCLTSCYFIYLSSRTKFFQFGLWMKMSVACNAWCQIWFQEVIEINFYCIWLIWLVEHWFSRVMHNISNTFGLSRLFFFFFLSCIFFQSTQTWAFVYSTLQYLSNGIFLWPWFCNIHEHKIVFVYLFWDWMASTFLI